MKRVIHLKLVKISLAKAIAGNLNLWGDVCGNSITSIPATKYNCIKLRDRLLKAAKEVENWEYYCTTKGLIK